MAERPGRETDEPPAEPAPSRWNPLRSEDAAFRWFVILLAAFAVFVALLLVARAL